MEASDFGKYRGRCRQLSEEAVAAEPTLTLVRGYYHCPIWGKQGHWWTKRPDGTIYDPTVSQFPSGGLGEYEEFDGYFNCGHCGKRVAEDDEEAHRNGNYIYCSGACLYADVMP